MSKKLFYVGLLLLAACAKSHDEVAPVALEGHWLCVKDSLTVFRADGSYGGASMLGWHHFTRIAPTAWADSLNSHRTDRYAYTRRGDTLVVSPGFVNYHDVPYTQYLRPAKHAILKLTAHELHLRTAEDTIVSGGGRYHHIFDRYYRR